MRWIGVDIGTMHIKAVAIDGGAIRAEYSERTPVDQTPTGEVSRDPSKVGAAVRRAIRHVASRQSRNADAAAISVASVGEEIVPVNSEGEPIGPVIAWFDQRGLEQSKAFEATQLHHRFPPDATWSIFKMQWLADHEPDQLALAHHFLDLGSFVLRQLGAPAVMDWSHASRTGLFDPERLCWDNTTLEQARLPRRLFPELVPSGQVIGVVNPGVADILGLSSSTLLVAGGHDHFVGAFGAGVRVGGDVYISAGTSEAQLVLATEPSAGQELLDEGRFVDEHLWYRHAASSGGHLFGQWRELLYAGDDDALEREISAYPSPTGIRIQLSTSDRWVTLAQVPLTAGRGLLMRAVCEGSAMASSDVFCQLAEGVDQRIERVVVAGHATASTLWRSLRAGLFDRALDVVQAKEVTAIGAALLARRGVTGDALPFSEFVRYEPQPQDTEVAMRLRQVYVDRGDRP